MQERVMIFIDGANLFHGLLFGFLFLSADIGDYIVNHLRPGFKCLACAGNSLIGTDKRAIESKFHDNQIVGFD